MAVIVFSLESQFESKEESPTLANSGFESPTLLFSMLLIWYL